MTLSEVISKLDSAEPTEKEEHYLTISKFLSGKVDSSYDDINIDHIKILCCNILNDLKKENELPQLVKILQFLFQNKCLQKVFLEAEKVTVIKDVINTIDYSLHENVLVNFFSALIQIPSNSALEDTILKELLQKMEDVLLKKNEPASTYAVCNYFQKFLKDYEERLSNFTPLLVKLVFLPLCHPSNKVREVAEKTLDMFPKILLYSSDEQATAYILKLLKETYCRDMLQLFKEKQEMYALKVWTYLVKVLGNALSTNLSIPNFFQVIEKGFKSPSDEICIASFNAWRSLIDNFAACDDFLNDSKRLRFILKPFKNITRSTENVLSVVCDTWMHLAWNLAGNLSSRFSEVCIPLLELTVGKISNGLPEKPLPKGGSIILVKKACYILLRLLELPPSESFSRLSSPKKLPNIPYPALQAPMDIKIIICHFKEILYVFKIIIDVYGTKDEMKMHLDCLMKSILFIVSTVIEDSSKESAEAINHFLNFLSHIIGTKAYPSLGCLKCLESLSKLSRKVLVSHCFNCGSRKPQDILCNTLLKLLLSPHLFPSETPKRFFVVYNRLVQAGIHESFHPLSNAHKFMNVIRSTVGTNNFDVDVLIEVWSGVATPLLEVIEKTQEVNQGDKQEHDFSCLYDVLMFPFEFIFPIYIHQFRIRPATKLWTSLYKAFIRCAFLVPTAANNEACESFCSKLKSYLKEDMLKKPHFFELLCTFLQSIMDSIDFVSGGTAGSQGIMDVSLMMKRKRPLGNLTSFVDLLVLLLKGYQAYSVEAEDDSVQSSAPTIQRKLHIVKNAAPLDILKTYFGNIKSGSLIPLSLEQLVDPVSKLFMKNNNKRTSIGHNDAKLETLWNVITSSIERYYLGPYDSDFLNLMSPLLEATFSHPKRNIKEKSRRFWFATFGPTASSLKFPDSLKNLLKKMKLSLLPEDISPAEYSVSPMPDSISEDSINVNAPLIPAPIVPKSPVISATLFKSPINGEASKAPTKDKQSPKVSIDDLPSEEFVKIDTPVISTPRRRQGRKRKSFVPSLYNDLSQDTASLMSSQESQSQDLGNSASLDENCLKESKGEKVECDVKELMSSPRRSHEEEIAVPKSLTNSPMSTKFEERLDESLKSQQFTIVKEVISVSSSDCNQEENPKLVKQSKGNSDSQSQQKIEEKDFKSDKISVFSKPGEKPLAARSTRRNTRLSQSFSDFTSEKKTENSEVQKLHNSCIELINLSDSEDIIPSSQGSSETDSSTKFPNNNVKQVSILGNNSDCDIIESKFEIAASPKKDNTEDIKSEIIHSKIATSTPLKSNLSAEFEEKVICKTSPENCKNNLNDVSALPGNSTAPNGKTDLSLPEIIVEKSQQESPLELSTDSKEIKDLNFLLVAVDNLVNSSQKPEDNLANKTSEQLHSDTEMKDISPSKVETISNPEAQKKTESSYEPIAKRSRNCLRASQSEIISSEDQMYSQKLRKKAENAVKKSQAKPKRRKINKKNDNLGKAGVDDKNTTTQLIIKNKDSEISEPVRTEIPSDVDMQPCFQVEVMKDEKNIDLKEKSASELNAKENAEHVNKIVEDVIIDNEASTQITENAESCEIFEMCSNSCESLQNDITEQEIFDSSSSNNASPESEEYKSSQDSQDCEAPKCSPCKLSIAFPQNAEMVETKNHSSLATNEVSGASSKHLNETSLGEVPKDTNHTDLTAITVIPSSLEGDDSSHIADKSETEFASKASVVDENCDAIPFKPEDMKLFNSKKKNTSDEGNKSCTDPESVNFVEIEDNLSCEMHSIVNSIAEVDSENSSDHKPIIKSADLRENQESQEFHFPELHSDKNSADNKNEVFDKSINAQKVFMERSNKDMSYLSSIEQQDPNNSSLGESNQDSKEFAMSDNSPLVIENCDKTIIKDRKLNASSDPVSILTTDTTNTKMAITKCDKNLTELDHSYSISQQIKDKFDSSHTNKDMSNTNKVINVSINCEYLERDFSDKVSTAATDVTENMTGVSSKSCSSISDCNEVEVHCILKDLIVRVEKLNVDALQNGSPIFNSDNTPENLYQTDSGNISESNHTSDKENQVASSSDDKFAKGSKKRKIKPPIRSPFNFRQRTKTDVSKKLSPKCIKSLNISQIKPAADKGFKILFSEDDLKDEDNCDSSMAKIISSIVDSISDEDDMITEMIPNVPSSSQMCKAAQRIELSTDELTDINTRLNAQIAHQTRRIKMIADSQTSAETDSEPTFSDTVTISTVDSSGNLSSILKKRKASESASPKKIRKVTFASPLIHELVYESCPESRGIETVTMNRLKNLNKKRKKILQEKNKAVKIIPLPPPTKNESEDVPSSSEYQDSDVLDFSDLPVAPALINCPDNVSGILKDLTSPSWVKGLESLLASKNIKTIGDVCKLNIHQVKALPFKSPKIVTLHKALMQYVAATQESTLQKIKTIDDGSFIEKDSPVGCSSSDSLKTATSTENLEEENPILIEETIKEMLKRGSLKDLPLSLLGQLIEACGKVIIERNK